VILLKTLRNIVPLLILSLSPSLFGQAVNATLLGTIKDATGATVPGAKVTVTDTATGTTHESVTNESGNYTLPDLPPEPTALLPKRTGSRRTLTRTSIF